MDFLSDINLLKNILYIPSSEESNSSSPEINSSWNTWFYLLLCLSLAFEIASAFLMPILGSFYSAIQNRNIDSFMHTLLQATILVALLGFIKSLRSFASDRFSLALRVAIVSRLHLNYMNEYTKKNYNQSDSQLPLDNIDQRCTQDVKDCTERISQLIQSVIICPFVIIFYSIYLSIFLSFLAPLFCLFYFLLGSICAATIQRLRFKSTFNTSDEDLISCIYIQQRREGDFRHQHAHCIGHVDSIRLLRGEEYERRSLQRSFLSLVSNSYRLIFKLLALNMVTNFFDYYGSIGIIFSSISFHKAL